ncbi:FHA domain-containing protein [Micromonospora sp. ATA51]|uniref:FHA domain-containing protein n=1 Tax=Micromonospora sp. ATA51 TaxID=2806098 RepID=UPI001A4F5865|nr:FHA domain-containing protein [Micromonospora sp. ATA51]MBM0224429.1 FHA domain-containing protein [Micromonospora sp. ATA51]
MVDLESSNGTYLNDPSSDPIDPNVPVPVMDGDKIYLGAWTVLTIPPAVSLSLTSAFNGRGPSSVDAACRGDGRAATV